MTPTARLLPAALVVAALAAPAQGMPCAASSLSPRLRDAVDVGRAAPTGRRRIVVGLSLRDRADLEATLREIADPASPAYRQFLSPEDFSRRFAPAPGAEAAVVAHLEASGLRVTDRFPNRLLVAAVGSSAAVERAFGVELHDVLVDGVARVAATREPELPAGVAEHVTGVLGLDDLPLVRPRHRRRPVAAPAAALGRNCCHLAPADVAALYDVPAGGSGGSGQTIVISGVYRWADRDIAAFDTQWGLPDLPSGSTQLCTRPGSGCRFNRKRSFEATLDVEMAHALAPAARVVSYMAGSTAVSALAITYERIVTDDPGGVVFTSWGACEADVATAVQEIDDGIFASASALGQAWFAASGDHGAQSCRGHKGPNRRAVSVDHPANVPHLVAVGGSVAVCSSGMDATAPGCAGYGGESAWPNSGGGVSQLFAAPAFQTGCGVPAGAPRLVPDVALNAGVDPGVYVNMNKRWFVAGGTSVATALWGGIFARVAERIGGTAPGAAGPLLYARCARGVLHDITVGSNGTYSAAPAYDPVTGLGSPDVAALLASF